MNQIATIGRPGGLPTLNGNQLGLVRRTVAADLTNDEFDMFIVIANRAGLDPFKKQIHAVVYNKKNPDKRKVSFITGIDGYRAIAARSGTYRPDEDPPRVVISDDLKNPDTNPLGIDYADVTVWQYGADKAWHKVTARAYWEEYAPLKEEWHENRETGRREPSGIFRLDTSGNWGRMPRLMIAKVAEANALRKGWPEDLGGLYVDAEMDRAGMIDITPSAVVENDERERRMALIGGDGILVAFDETEGLKSVPIGQFADRCLAFIRSCPNSGTLAWWQSFNRAGLQQFWGKSKADALEVKKAIEARADELAQAEANQEAEAQ
ncbi:phage recombination protein Bet [Zavarzinia compransoris]|uniref:phage recombination protein Bet n=1 Tax=Zavarzinia marina TaxID=2911065 RepID=UPI001F1DA50E|nr:phage recombination protein Bet [Zavarzinia marina]MCF4166369.1 phage recombination protein Bet [Zavarzinia marina]